MYAIKRLQADKGTWYYVVHLSRAGKMHYRRFYEPKYGSRRAARKAAVAWRDDMLRKLAPLSITEFATIKRSNNRSGVPGVSRLTKRRQPEGVWQARLTLHGGPTRTASFSVRLHGEQGAFHLAVEARRRMLAEAKDRAFVHSITAKRATRLP